MLIVLLYHIVQNYRLNKGLYQEFGCNSIEHLRTLYPQVRLQTDFPVF